MRFHLSSFQRWHRRVDPVPELVYSIAVYQPEWYPEVEVAKCFNILDDRGRWIRPRNFIPDGHDGRPDRDLMNRYFRALLLNYESRAEEIQRWVQDHRHSQSVYLLCWCPHDRAAKRQISQYGSFVCHSAAVGYYLRQQGCDVVYDNDRRKMIKVGKGIRKTHQNSSQSA